MNPSLTSIVSGTLALLTTFALAFTSATPARAALETEMTLPSGAPSDLSAPTLDVIHLYFSGANPDVLTAFVQSADQLFNLSAADVDYLINIGLPQEAIAVMLQTDNDNRARLAAEQARAEADELSQRTANEPPAEVPLYSSGDLPYYFAYPNDDEFAYDNPDDFPIFVGPPFAFSFVPDQSHHHRHFGHNRNFGGHSATSPQQHFGGSRTMASRGRTGGSGHGGGGGHH